MSKKNENASIVEATILAKKHLDTWQNIVTGMNVMSKDARRSDVVKWQRLTESDIENLYAGDAMATKIVDMPIDDAFKEGYCWTGIDKTQEKKLKAKLKELKFDTAVQEAAKKARQYGGAAILKGYDDNLVLKDPKSGDPKIKSLVVFQRFELFTFYEDVNKDMLNPDFGKPLLYTFTGRRASGEAGNTLDIKVHASRLVRFEGARLPDRLEQSNGYWGDSVLSKVYDAIRNYAHAHESINSALKDLSTAVFKIKNLADQISTVDGDSKILTRMQMVNITKSMVRAVVLDAEGEEFDYKVRNLTGAADLVKKSEDRLAAETSFPHTVLFGNSPAGGLGQSGNHEENNWYNFVSSMQIMYLQDKMLDIAKEVATELGLPTEDLGIKFNPLFKMSEKELAETRNKQANTDQMYITQGVVDPSEIRESRFGGDEYSYETTVEGDLDESLTQDPATIGKPTQEAMAKDPYLTGKKDAEIMDMLEQFGHGWVIKSKDGKKKLGTFKSKEEAVKRLREIEYFKHKQP